MYEFKLPDLGEGIHEGEILKWHAKQGDTVGEDDPLVDVETDKAAVTIPSPRGGRIVSTSGEVGETIEVGTIIAVIDTGDGAAGASVAKKEIARPALAKAASAVTEAPPPAPVATAVAAPGRTVLAAPATRRLAREAGVDISRITGSGPAGRVTSEDVKRFVASGGPDVDIAAAPAPAPGAGPAIPFMELGPLPRFEDWGPVEREPIRSIRRKVARKMVTSMVLVPHVAHMDEADVTELDDFRRREKARRRDGSDAGLTLLPFVMKAITVELKARPAFNASVDPFREEIVYKKFYNIGFAADTDKGLIVPVVKNADQKTTLEISAEIVRLAAQARDETVDAADLRGGTFTVTNVGAIGGTGAVPTINYPEVAILAMGRTQEKPVVRDGRIVIRRMLPLTLTFDHRVIDGADAARFVTALVRRLSEPMHLLLEL